MRLVVGGVLAILLAGCGTNGPKPQAAAEPKPTATQAAWQIPSDESIRRLLAERMQHNGMGVVVGIVEPGGKRVVAYGSYADGDPRKLDGDTIFQIGSLTKVFTGLLLADMTARGEVALDDPANKYLPQDAQLAERGRPIALVDMARHRSGLPPMPTNLSVRGRPDPYEAYTEQDLWRFVRTWQPTRSPGEAGEYSNLGYALLGRLLALRAGTDYDALLKARVLKPLGMTSTSIGVPPGQEGRLAPGHDRYLRMVHRWEMTAMPASGSLRSSMNDMLKFMSAYVGRDATPLDNAISVQLKDGEKTERDIQALGWTVRPDGVTLKDGGKSGYRTGAAFNRRTGQAVVVFANARTDDSPILIALHLLTGRELEHAPAAPTQKPILQMKPADLDRYEGRYLFASGKVLEIARSGDHLVAISSGNGGLTLYPTSEADFFLNTGNDEFVFSFSESNSVKGLTQYGEGRSNEGALAARIGPL